MLLDLSDCNDQRLCADVCVIGSGAAGITVATELADGPLSAIVLESGGFSAESDTQDLYRSEIAGLTHGGIHGGRVRVFGGTTTLWAGQALPLMGIDLRHRRWVPHSGWPIDPSELESYYERACRLLEIPPFPPVERDSEQSLIDYEPAFHPALLVPLVSRFSPRPNFATGRGRQLLDCGNVQVVLHANVTELVTDRSGSVVETACARALSGRELTVEAKTFVLCAGGIETPRLLLASERYCSGGLGNGRDLVGRFFQDHPGVVVGPIHSSDRSRMRRTFQPRRIRGIRYQPLFRVSEELQSRDSLLNVAGSAIYPMSEALRSAKQVFSSIRHRRLGADLRAPLRDVARHPRTTLAAAGRYFLLRQPALDTTGVPVLTIGCEQAPNPESRVYLSRERDAVGMRRLVLDWRLTGQELRTWQRFAEVAAGEFERCGFGSVAMDQFRLPKDPDDLSDVVVDGGHHIGTTRMATDQSGGVVDSDCRVFGVGNLYIAGPSVFPTGGFSNPVLTIMALAIRLSDHLRSPATAGASAR